MASKYVAVESDGIVEVHLPASATGNYLTLCGLDGDDSAVGQHPAEVPRGARVTCAGCRGIWQTAKQFRDSDFAKERSDGK
jgi:hypothetical protein